MGIEIKNDSDENVSWFVFNGGDTGRLVALGSGDLVEKGKPHTFNPPDNPTGTYAVRITNQGGGAALQENTVGKDATVTYSG